MYVSNLNKYFDENKVEELSHSDATTLTIAVYMEQEFNKIREWEQISKNTDPSNDQVDNMEEDVKFLKDEIDKFFGDKYKD